MSPENLLQREKKRQSQGRNLGPIGLPAPRSWRVNTDCIHPRKERRRARPSQQFPKPLRSTVSPRQAAALDLRKILFSAPLAPRDRPRPRDNPVVEASSSVLQFLLQTSPYSTSLILSLPFGTGRFLACPPSSDDCSVLPRRM